MDAPHAQSQFPVTRWTAVVQVCQAEDDRARREALAGICQDYWYPLYAFARRLGHTQPDAEDLTQEFFSYLLENNVLARASRELGRLRTFLLTVFQRHIGDAVDRRRAQKRGGRHEFVSLDLLGAEELYRHEPADLDTPERLFERSWARHILRSALDSLRKSEAAKGNGPAFEILAPFLDPESTANARTGLAADQLGLSVEAVRQAISRLRRRFRDALRLQIAGTLQNPAERHIDEELTSLHAALQS
ncbi:MAG TPA: sigma-70 family RNA polymerase sigma factor [Verrucomicrobiales bacterium]|jgi:RNA polymerase sigma-70 factor (ECF subfamily)|nr:sigma-70 family RNA polymerase sigma factor [Verrucomicrobiales bacterium]